MSKPGYQSLNSLQKISRRSFIKSSGALGAGIALGTPTLWAQEKQRPNQRPATNLEHVLNIPKTELSVPGKFPGKVVEILNDGSMVNNQPDDEVVKAMFAQGIEQLTGKNLSESYRLRRYLQHWPTASSALF